MSKFTNQEQNFGYVQLEKLQLAFCSHFFKTQKDYGENMM